MRPTWTRDIGLKSWSKGTDYMLALITSPAKEKGLGFLKLQKDLWNWQPSIRADDKNVVVCDEAIVDG